jgi:hypothetical protein
MCLDGPIAKGRSARNSDEVLATITGALVLANVRAGTTAHDAPPGCCCVSAELQNYNLGFPKRVVILANAEPLRLVVDAFHWFVPSTNGVFGLDRAAEAR